MITYQSDGIPIPTLDFAKINRWLTGVATGKGRRIGDLTYRFCTDETILETNRQFLDHDYFTDIITFDYTVGNRVGADILISLETVESNAKALGVPFVDELHRVIVHGLLHLCGIKDKTPAERAEMEKEEDAALRQLYEF